MGTTTTITGPFGVHRGKECDGTQGEEYVDASSGKASDLDACRKSCEDANMCQSITYHYGGGWCSHYSSPCEKMTSCGHDCVAMRLKDNYLNHEVCDESKGELFLDKTSGKTSDLDACKKSCEDALLCQSIAFFYSGWCSHFATACTHTRPEPSANS